MPELFLEIGTEEIPSRFMGLALDYLKNEMSVFFEKNRIQADDGRVMGTPRRLVVSFDRVDAQQKDVVETHFGPNVKVAFDGEGNPTNAALGFARGKGIDVSQLTVEKTPKGEVVCARIEKTGQPTADILNSFLPDLIGNIPFPKKMRWGNRKTSFVRPLHWIAALFENKPLNFNYEGISCADVSHGHRFLSSESFKVNGVTSYLDSCEKHFILVDPVARKQAIVDQITLLAEEVGGTIELDSDLLEEVNYLVEFPFAIRGNFEERFLELPRELLIITMKYHQKYFPVVNEQGDLLPHFITISNMKPGSGGEIQHGNERVLRARLEDARFFFDEDRKKKLEDFVEPLKRVTFQKVLGTSYEKVERIVALAEFLAKEVCPEKIQQVSRTAWLCKADLVSQMVYEFPELQGIMGGYYADHSGEDSEVGLAIKEHYSPAFTGDESPSSQVGSIVSIADKLDTILGCIGVKLIPSGSEDPYGLRRHSLGIIQIVLDRGWQVSLDTLIEKGIDRLKDKIKLTPDEVRTHTIGLFSQRYKTFLSGQEYPYDAVDAVLSAGIDSLADVQQKVIALSDLKKQPHFELLATAFRRVVSILNEEADGEVQVSLLKEPAEKKLYDEYQRIKEPVENCLDKKEFPQALEKIVEIKEAVDGFFDNVMVMVREDELRINRLRLLKHISLLFSTIADFSKIVLK
ncbi:MAG TPA: glycine--tRNA ligase subunit beta [Nitrospina sp.]|nr:glycine--tRNA ligase subunit beta [Nitrospina sp.]